MKSVLRLPAVALIALLSVAAAVSFDLPDPDVFRAHLDRWRGMDTEQQEVLVRRWREFKALSETDQRALMERMGALRRLRRHYAAEHPAASGSGSGNEALTVIMGSVEKRARDVLRLDARTDVHGAVKQNQRQRILAFLDNLARNDRLTTAERDRLGDLALDDLVRESLVIQKREVLALYAEVDTPEDLAELQALDPVEVMAHIRRKRQERVFLGRAGQLLELSGARRRQLAAAIEAGQMDRVLDHLRPLVAEALAERGTDQHLIDETLELPFAEMERRLARIMRSLPEPKSR